MSSYTPAQPNTAGVCYLTTSPVPLTTDFRPKKALEKIFKKRKNYC